MIICLDVGNTNIKYAVFDSYDSGLGRGAGGSADEAVGGPGIL